MLSVCRTKQEEASQTGREDMVDVFHTFFGIAGLSLMQQCNLEAINPVYALPESVIRQVIG